MPKAAQPRVRRDATRATGIPASQWPAFRRGLLAWFRRNRRDLPWRRNRDPYRVWLSEIMLQQTRVAAAIPYYEQFLEKFPTVHHLARARIASVLRAWSGLGYYSRARNLHRAAQQIVAEHDGKFPKTRDAALELPGIGRYTVAAILSIAYGEPLAALDGNVARVLTRIGALRGSDAKREIEHAADMLLAAKSPGDWNEAMMELGATVCTPRGPRCDECPVARWCQAHQLGIAETLPESRSKSAPVLVTIAAAVLLDPGGRTLLLHQADGNGAIFARLWQFPAVEANGDAMGAIRKRLESILPGSPELGAAQLEPLAKVRHAVTFRDVRLLPFLWRVPQLPPLKGSRAVPLDSLGNLGISNATRKIAHSALRAI